MSITIVVSPEERERLRAVCRKKARHPTENAAESMLASLIRGNRARVNADVYQCEFCDGWHVTGGRH